MQLHSSFPDDISIKRTTAHLLQSLFFFKPVTKLSKANQPHK